jgi:hypothetical protein
LNGRRVRIPAALALGAVMVFGCGHPPARTAEAVAATHTDTGIALVNQKRLSPRLSELTFTSSALDGTTKVRVLLPRGYDAEKGRRYPVEGRALRVGHRTVPRRRSRPACPRSW